MTESGESRFYGSVFVTKNQQRRDLLWIRKLSNKKNRQKLIFFTFFFYHN